MEIIKQCYFYFKNVKFYMKGIISNSINTYLLIGISFYLLHDN